MYELIGGIIGFGLAVVASKWHYARTILGYALDGLGLAKRFGLDDRLPEWAVRIAERAIIAANEAEVRRLVEKLTTLQEQGTEEQKAALARGRALAEGMAIELVEPTGDEPTSKPFAHLKR